MHILLSQGKVSSLVKLELRVEFNQDKCKHKAYDKRKPGLFKVEWEGQGIVALCFKTSLVVRVSTKNAMTSTKTSTFKFC